MKIKTVCSATGLTDRAIRHYIEEELIFPSYTENYLGRRDFDFSETDIRQLREIAVLRKYDFSVCEIRDMIRNPSVISTIVQSLKLRKQALLENEELHFKKLCETEHESFGSISDLAELLAEPVADTPNPTEVINVNYTKQALRIGKTIPKLLIPLIPILFVIYITSLQLAGASYPIISWLFAFLAFLSMIPSFFVFVAPKLKLPGQQKKKLQLIAFLLCILCLPVNIFLSACIVDHSETNDIRNYRMLDAACAANRYSFYQELFPPWPYYFKNTETGTEYLDAHYHYAYYASFDYTYDIYAEWSLEEDKFRTEAQRVHALFEGYEHEIIRTDNYTCLIYTPSPSGQAFEAVSDSYTYFIFAYDEANFRVRYILCDSLENGADQPYYLSLDW